MSALSTNPALTSLPLPRPSLLSPKDLDYNTGTAEILRLPEVMSAISSDFLVLPCDLVCELPGEKLVETWMITAASLPRMVATSDSHSKPWSSSPLPQSGGLSVWYDTKSATTVPVKGEETDFLMTTPLAGAPAATCRADLIPRLHNLVYSMPTDSLKDLFSEKGGLPTRHSLLRKFSRARMVTTHRDAHIYILPKWVIELVNRNGPIENIGEDVIGWWAKAGWQRGLLTKLGLGKIFNCEDQDEEDQEDLIRPPIPRATVSRSRRKALDTSSGSSPLEDIVPPILAYIHPPVASAPLIRRVDTSQLLLQVSLQIAKLSASDENAAVGASPFAHAKKVAYPEGVRPRTTITQKDCLVAENVTVEEKTAIKETVIGANCQIKEGAKLLQCLLMDGVVVGKNCKLTRCIIGRRAEVGDGSVLTDVEVQENLLVGPRSELPIFPTSFCPLRPRAVVH